MINFSVQFRNYESVKEIGKYADYLAAIHASRFLRGFMENTVMQIIHTPSRSSSMVWKLRWNENLKVPHFLNTCLHFNSMTLKPWIISNLSVPRIFFFAIRKQSVTQGEKLCTVPVGSLRRIGHFKSIVYFVESIL